MSYGLTGLPQYLYCRRCITTSLPRVSLFSLCYTGQLLLACNSASYLESGSILIPKNYKCSKCETRGVKLWRGYQESPVTLLCGKCLPTKPNLEKYDAAGWDVPAVPTLDEIESYWGYSSVPPEGVAWWNALPLYLDEGWKDKDGLYEWCSIPDWKKLIWNNSVELARIDHDRGRALLLWKRS